MCIHGPQHYILSPPMWHTTVSLALVKKGRCVLIPTIHLPGYAIEMQLKQFIKSFLLSHPPLITWPVYHYAGIVCKPNSTRSMRTTHFESPVKEYNCTELPIRYKSRSQLIIRKYHPDQIQQRIIFYTQVVNYTY